MTDSERWRVSEILRLCKSVLPHAIFPVVKRDLSEEEKLVATDLILEKSGEIWLRQKQAAIDAATVTARLAGTKRYRDSHEDSTAKRAILDSAAMSSRSGMDVDEGSGAASASSSSSSSSMDVDEASSSSSSSSSSRSSMGVDASGRRAMLFGGLQTY